MLPLLVWLFTLLSARADDVAWYQGNEVAQVSLVAPEGGLPEENLEPLLRARQGEKLDLELVRADLALLFQVGGFDAVEAWVEPWLSVDEAGDRGECARTRSR